jgi:hypothetical protein
VLEVSGMRTSVLEIGDIAVDALGVLQWFGGLKLDFLDIP